MDERRHQPDDEEPIRLEHDGVLDRLEAFRRRTATTTATEALVDLTLLEPRADLVVLPEPDDQTGA
jgi:hypothetical protein